LDFLHLDSAPSADGIAAKSTFSSSPTQKSSHTLLHFRSPSRVKYQIIMEPYSPRCLLLLLHAVSMRSPIYGTVRMKIPWSHGSKKSHLLLIGDRLSHLRSDPSMMVGLLD
jgi:hypothetical protein